MAPKPELWIRLNNPSYTAGEDVEGTVLVHLPTPNEESSLKGRIWKAVKLLKGGEPKSQQGLSDSASTGAGLAPEHEFSSDSDEEDFYLSDDEGDLPDDSVTLVGVDCEVAHDDKSGAAAAAHWSSKLSGVRLRLLGMETTLAHAPMGSESEFKWLDEEIKLFDAVVSSGRPQAEEEGGPVTDGYLKLNEGHTLAFNFKLRLPPKLLPTHPAPRQRRLFSCGEETIAYTLSASAEFCGSYRTHKVCADEALHVRQKPPSTALNEFKAYCAKEELQTDGPLQSTRSFWFYRGRAECTVELNKRHFFLHAVDVPVLFVTCDNSSTVNMTSLEVKLIACQYSKCISQDADASRSYEELEVDLYPALLDACASATVRAGESRGFTLPLKIVRPRSFPPSINGKIMRVEYRLDVTFHFDGVTTATTVSLPLRFCQAPSWFSVWAKNCS